jgi:hypothetical protein
VSTGISNRGSGFGLALNIDLSKPRPPLISTRLEVRIRDRVTDKVLWEGRAEAAGRESGSNADSQKIATRLADALFEGFPGRAGETIERK